MSAFAIYGKSSPLTKPRNKKSTPVKGNGPQRPKSDWDPYLTDLDRFKLPADKLLMKQKQLVSKNNILHADSSEKRLRSRSLTERSNGQSPAVMSRRNPSRFEDDNANQSTDIMNLTALDILDEGDDTNPTKQAVSPDSEMAMVREHNRIQLQGELAMRKHTRQSNKGEPKLTPNAKASFGSQGKGTSSTVGHPPVISKDAPSRGRSPASVRNKATTTDSSTFSSSSPSMPSGRENKMSLVTPLTQVDRQTIVQDILDVGAADADIANKLLLRNRCIPEFPASHTSIIGKASWNEVIAQVRVLVQEMRDYEMLTEKRDGSHTKALGDLIDGMPTADAAAVFGLVRALIGLSSQQMTYLLQSEVESRKMKETLARIMVQSQSVPPVSSHSVLKASYIESNHKSDDRVAGLTSGNPVTNATPNVEYPKGQLSIMSAHIADTESKPKSSVPTVLPSKEIFICKPATSGTMSIAPKSSRTDVSTANHSKSTGHVTPPVTYTTAGRPSTLDSNETTTVKGLDLVGRALVESSPIPSMSSTLSDVWQAMDATMTPLRSQSEPTAPRSFGVASTFSTGDTMPALTASMSPPRSTRSYIVSSSFTPSRTPAHSHHQLDLLDRNVRAYRSCDDTPLDAPGGNRPSEWIEIPVHQSPNSGGGGDTDDHPWLGGYQPPSSDENYKKYSDPDSRPSSPGDGFEEEYANESGWAQGNEAPLRLFDSGSPMRHWQTSTVSRERISDSDAGAIVHTPMRVPSQVGRSNQPDLKVSETPLIKSRAEQPAPSKWNGNAAHGNYAPNLNADHAISTPIGKIPTLSGEHATTVSRQRHNSKPPLLPSAYHISSDLSSTTRSILAEYTDVSQLPKPFEGDDFSGVLSSEGNAEIALERLVTDSSGFVDNDEDEAFSFSALPSPKLPPRPYINATPHPYGLSSPGTAGPGLVGKSPMKVVYDARNGSY